MNYPTASLMPYTLAHPGFILPLKRWFPKLFSVSGCIAGSIAPDFDIIFRFTETRFHIFTYNLAEIVFLILPISLFLALYLKYFVRPMVVAPSEKLIVPGRRDIPFFSILFSALASILLHLWLDSILHIEVYTFRQKFLQHVLIHPDQVKNLDMMIMYGPALVGTFIGFFLFLWFLWQPEYKKLLLNCITWLRFKDIVFFISCTLIVSTFKIIRNGLMPGFGADLMAIAFTSGIIAAAFLLPIFHFFSSKPILEQEDKH